MTKLLKSVFLVLAFVGVQPNQVYSVDWESVHNRLGIPGAVQGGIVNVCALLGGVIGCYCAIPREKEAWEDIQFERRRYQQKATELEKNPRANAAAINNARASRNEGIAESMLGMAFAFYGLAGMLGGALAGAGVVGSLAVVNKVASKLKP